MSELQISRAEIEDLAQKLESAQLSPREKHILLAIFAAAGSQVVSSSPEDPGGAGITLANLRVQLLGAFIPEGVDFPVSIPNIEPGPDEPNIEPGPDEPNIEPGPDEPNIEPDIYEPNIEPDPE